MTKAIVLIVLPLLGQIKRLAGLPSQGKASPLRILNRALLSAAFTGTFFVLVVPAFAQTETATVSGRVTDTDGRVVPDVRIELVNTETNAVVTAKTNAEGLYVIANVHPGVSGLRVAKNGFKKIVKTGLVLHVQDRVEENFSLQVGSVSESVTVTADQLNINTTDATVSTVVDRQFAENLPLNGRSFQSLIQLTPGVVLTGNNGVDQGQFSVNGQRADANYWTIDGVSANVGIGANGFGAGPGIAGLARPMPSEAPIAWSRWMLSRNSASRPQRMRRSLAANPGAKSLSSRAPARISFTVRCSTTFGMTSWTRIIGSRILLVSPSRWSARMISGLL
jgi:Carboxypeptidase regulatory-like domain